MMLTLTSNVIFTNQSPTQIPVQFRCCSEPVNKYERKLVNFTENSCHRNFRKVFIDSNIPETLVKPDQKLANLIWHREQESENPDISPEQFYDDYSFLVIFNYYIPLGQLTSHFIDKTETTVKNCNRINIIDFSTQKSYVLALVYDPTYSQLFVTIKENINSSFYLYNDLRKRGLYLQIRTRHFCGWVFDFYSRYLKLEIQLEFKLFIGIFIGQISYKIQNLKFYNFLTVVFLAILKLKFLNNFCLEWLRIELFELSKLENDSSLVTLVKSVKLEALDLKLLKFEKELSDVVMTSVWDLSFLGSSTLTVLGCFIKLEPRFWFNKLLELNKLIWLTTWSRMSTWLVWFSKSHKSTKLWICFW